jgi:hypothetical protein
MKRAKRPSHWLQSWYHFSNSRSFLDVRVGNWRWLNAWLCVAKDHEEEIEYRSEWGRWITLGLGVAWLRVVLCVLHSDRHLVRTEVHFSVSRRLGT